MDTPPPFRFKKFVVEQAPGVHPVGTDAVLLGAWAPAPEQGSILDIGCGTGVVALLLAQRTPAEVQVYGIDVHPLSVTLAKRNASATPWRDRLIFREANAANWSGEGALYDLVVSNPPYFSETTWSPDDDRKRARHLSSLRPGQLLEATCRLLAPEGRLCVILPPVAAQHFTEAGACLGLYVTRRLDVVTRPGKKTERMLLVLERTPYLYRRERLILLDGKGNPASGFKRLCGAFYLGWE
ncbi:MAG: methyltransferase domain-containing protein [Saprospiraceae bacterium]|nr:methyltransferase domain-containing protein [Saprospiraceae bacterium]